LMNLETAYMDRTGQSLQPFLQVLSIPLSHARHEERRDQSGAKKKQRNRQARAAHIKFVKSLPMRGKPFAF